LSWNVLLPNSQDGWWTYKMYSPPLPESRLEVASWTFRRDLLRQRIRQIGEKHTYFAQTFICANLCLLG
jgi:hypothetical protein